MAPLDVGQFLLPKRWLPVTAALTELLARFEATETNDQQLPGDQSQPLSREPAVPSSQRKQIQQACGEEGLFSISSGTGLQARSRAVCWEKVIA